MYKDAFMWCTPLDKLVPIESDNVNIFFEGGGLGFYEFKTYFAL